MPSNKSNEDFSETALKLIKAHKKLARKYSKGIWLARFWKKTYQLAINRENEVKKQAKIKRGTLPKEERRKVPKKISVKVLTKILDKQAELENEYRWEKKENEELRKALRDNINPLAIAINEYKKRKHLESGLESGIRITRNRFGRKTDNNLLEYIITSMKELDSEEGPGNG